MSIHTVGVSRVQIFGCQLRNAVAEDVPRLVKFILDLVLVLASRPASSSIVKLLRPTSAG